MMRPVTDSGIEIRPGTLQDLAQVSEFTNDTFSWGDYLPGVWERWVSSKHGTLLVAATDGFIIGTARVSFLGNQEAWLEGVRVRHTHRGRGVGSLLVKATHAIASKKNCRIIRLETGSNNLAAQSVFKRFGYRRTGTYAGFKAPARTGGLDHIRRAMMDDLDVCWEMWQHSWVKRASRRVVPSDYGWRWWEFTRERLAQEIRSKRVWVGSNAFFVLRDEGDAFDITLLIGTRPHTTRMLSAVRAVAVCENKKEIYWLTPQTAIAACQAAEGGLVLDEVGLEIYACELQAPRARSSPLVVDPH
jgi:ribosomal protein S18 acetylase RimI-like enzyme